MSQSFQFSVLESLFPKSNKCDLHMFSLSDVYGSSESVKSDVSAEELESDFYLWSSLKLGTCVIISLGYS